MTKADLLAKYEQQRRDAYWIWQQATEQAARHREAMLRIEGAILAVKELPDDPPAEASQVGAPE